MAALNRTEIVALGLSVLAAVAAPWLIVNVTAPSGGNSASSPSANAALRPKPVPEPESLYSRPLFAPPLVEAEDALPADAPQLVGVAGRIGSDAVALVRSAAGESRSLRPGDGVDGWRLVSLSADAAFFTRGRDHVRVSVPASSDTEDVQEEAAPETDQ